MTGFADTVDVMAYSTDITLTADFGTSTIYGHTSARQYEDGSTDFGIIINPAPITGNTFSAAVSLNAVTCTALGCPVLPVVTDSSVDGTFFGSKADEVGGTYSFTTTMLDGSEQISVGNFVGKKSQE